MNNPDYWRVQIRDSGVQYLGQLLINMANRALDPLERIVWAEARGEDLKGQILVANVVMNRHNSPNFPDGIYNVIHQNSVNSQGETVWQFTPARPRANGQPNPYEAAQPFPMTKQAVNEALNGKDYSRGALFFRSVRGLEGSWNQRSLRHLFAHEGHAFFR